MQGDLHNIPNSRVMLLANSILHMQTEPCAMLVSLATSVKPKS